MVLRLSEAYVGAPYMGSHYGIKQRRKILKMEIVPVQQYFIFYYYLELSLIFFIKTIEKYLDIGPRTGTKCQIKSHSSKLTTPRQGNRTIGHENEI
jgi:hypothetical protein